jgi:uncharacterized protein (UPF0276 family)
MRRARRSEDEKEEAMRFEGGFGIGLRAEYTSALLTTERAIDWLEILAENWLDVGGACLRDLEACAERWPIVPHGVTMSIGGVSPLDRRLFEGMNALCRAVAAPFWSDHVCYATVQGTYFNDLLPLPFSEEALDHVVARIGEASRMADVPLVFENPTFYVAMPGATMTEDAFLSAVIRRSGAGLLLDVNNVYVNATNHGYDPATFLERLPLEAVRQIHLAGHTPDSDGTIIDTHVGPIPEEVWELYRHTLRAAGRAIPTLIEWDAQIPALDVVVDELDRARAEAGAALGSLVGRAA